MDAVKELLDRQGGIARRRDLLAAGLSRRQLARRVESGELRALTPQLFTDRQEPTADELLRAVAINLDAVVGHTSAALLWGLELAATPKRRTVTVGRDRSRALHPGVDVRRADLAEETTSSATDYGAPR
ncbi:MAG: type IV toxin-antitoxin system AbiEi family antitoxin domain-containing protein [Frankiales bacterium]|nr:type IV toxin-antitoxin system AbiEi family antitoxin domain-containing protein [Frankiales bacterium]